ncbi:hypothetical protein Q7P35_011264 [Cladosporium inversicolor]
MLESRSAIEATGKSVLRWSATTSNPQRHTTQAGSTAIMADEPEEHPNVTHPGRENVHPLFDMIKIGRKAWQLPVEEQAWRIEPEFVMKLSDDDF